jgi:hypothetical protein
MELMIHLSKKGAFDLLELAFHSLHCADFDNSKSLIVRLKELVCLGCAAVSSYLSVAYAVYEDYISRWLCPVVRKNNLAVLPHNLMATEKY